MDLFKVKSIIEVKKEINDQFNNFLLKTENIDISQAIGRVLAEDIHSEINVPHFHRSVVDGFAVKYKDVNTASETLPAFLDVIGEVKMGHEASFSLETGQTVYVPTGGMLPKGADSVVMIEHTENFDDQSIAIYKAVSFKENMMAIGDDIKKDEKVLNKGVSLRPQDIGVLSSIGKSMVKVYSKPVFAIISTGDEIVDPNQEVKPGQIKDINTFTISAIAEKLGGHVLIKEVVNDDLDKLKDTMVNALEKVDIVVISGGSSVGKKDFTYKILETLGKPGIFVHGIAVKPGKPTILANINGKPVIGLPGQPASAMVVFNVIIKHLLGVLYQKDVAFEQYFEARLKENIHSAPGRETYQMVELKQNNFKYEAIPVYGKSGMITLISKATGYIKIPMNKEGLKQGDIVKVYIF